MPSAWVQWTMPSVADLFFAAVLCALVFTPLSVKLLGDAGIGWHIRTGQQIMATHAVPRVDSFSSTMAGRPWFAWEWLYDLVVGWLDATFGLNGPVWLTALVIAATFALLFHWLLRLKTDLPIALALLLLATGASMIHFLARPHVFSWLLLVIWFWILDSDESSSLRFSTLKPVGRLWVLPLLMLLWVNLHGGFLLGFALICIFWLGALWNWWQSSDVRIEDTLLRIAARRQLGRLTLAGIATVAASLANPYGWRLHAHIYSYLTNRFLVDHIQEFQSPNFHHVAEKCFLALLLVSVAILLGRGRTLRASGILTVLFSIYAGLTASRNIPFAAILLCMVLGPAVPKARLWVRFAERMEYIDSRVRGHLWPVFVVIFTLAIMAHGGRVGSDQWMNAHFDPQRMPVGAANFLASESIKGPVLSPDYWGGYLIYRLYPGTRVVVDDRHDLYGSEFFQSYLNLMHVEDGWDRMLRQFNPGCVLLRREDALSNMLRNASGWKSVYSDELSVLFVSETETHSPVMSATGGIPPRN